MNKIFLIGRLTSDVTLNTTQSGVSNAKFGLAVNRRFSGKNGEKEADFFNVVAWRQTADLCSQYLAKGRQVAVTGSIQINKYQAQDGSTRISVDVIAEEVEFLTPKDANATNGVNNGNAANAGNGLVEDPSVQADDLPF